MSKSHDYFFTFEHFPDAPFGLFWRLVLVNQGHRCFVRATVEGTPQRTDRSRNARVHV